MKMFNYKYLTREHLEGFDNYKYMAIDTSPLSVYVMHPFWNKVVELVPRWVAPNVLTFAGFLLTVADFLLLSYYDYDYTASVSPNVTATGTPLAGDLSPRIPQSLWVVLAVFLFLAYTLDGIDGKQARRTQTSGPLGELFDHGLDSYSIFFIPACLYSIFGRADFSISPTRMYYVMLSILMNFYISHWEKYNTGVLFLPWGYDFGMWASTMFFLWTGMNGTTFYKRYIWGGYTLADGFEVLIYATGIFTNLPVAIYNTYRSHQSGSGKKHGWCGALRPLSAVALALGATTLWVVLSPDLADAHPRMLFVLVGTLFSNVACRLIVAQMSGTSCPTISWIGVSVAVVCGAAQTVPRLEGLLLYAITAVVLAAHLHYGVCVVRQMCDHFRVRCFHIKQRAD